MSLFEINDSNPQLHYAYNVKMSFYDRTFISRHITSENDQLVKWISGKNKFHFNFPSIDKSEGFIHVWYIVLENEKSYLMAFGTILSTPIQVGGYFGDIKKEDISYRRIEKHLKRKAKKCTHLYVKKKLPDLVDEMNNLHIDLSK
jgi:hypothetical protein